MGIKDLHKLFLKNPNITTDTREIIPNSIFFALKGDNFDGNKFAKKAIELGASYTVIDNKDYKENEKFILVEDVLKTLQSLASYHRNQLKIPVIGITGTNGKTTTKELINSVLSQKYNCFATAGNFNNHIGVPLSLLSINNSHEIAVIEMGANHLKEIEFLCSIAGPDFGVITNIGKAHLEGFGSLEGVKKGKTELYRYLIANNKIAFINADDNNLNEYITKIESITYGSKLEYYCSGSTIDIEPTLSIQYKTEKNKGELTSNLIGKYNFDNILVAVTIGDYFDLSSNQIKKGIESYMPQNSRSQLIKTENNKIVLDAYNANPSSMKEAIDSFSQIKGSEKLAILGDMLELGKESLQEHKIIVEKLISLKINTVLVGDEFGKIKQNIFLHFNTVNEAKDYIKKLNMEGHLILIKGSRGIKLENILESIS